MTSLDVCVSAGHDVAGRWHDLRFEPPYGVYYTWTFGSFARSMWRAKGSRVRCDTCKLAVNALISERSRIPAIMSLAVPGCRERDWY